MYKSENLMFLFLAVVFCDMFLLLPSNALEFTPHTAPAYNEYNIIYNEEDSAFLTNFTSLTRHCAATQTTYSVQPLLSSNGQDFTSGLFIVVLNHTKIRGYEMHHVHMSSDADVVTHSSSSTYTKRHKYRWTHTPANGAGFKTNTH